MTTLRLDSLKANTGARRRKLRKGRGIAAGQGASCGFGMRGQKSRSGRPTRPGFEGGQMPLYRKLPRRGFNNSRFNREKLAWVNIDQLERFDANQTVGPKQLREAGLIRGNADVVKILGNGELGKSLTIEANRFSESAKKKIEAAGGKAVLV